MRQLTPAHRIRKNILSVLPEECKVFVLRETCRRATFFIRPIPDKFDIGVFPGVKRQVGKTLQNGIGGIIKVSLGFARKQSRL